MPITNYLEEARKLLMPAASLLSSYYLEATCRRILASVLEAHAKERAERDAEIARGISEAESHLLPGQVALRDALRSLHPKPTDPVLAVARETFPSYVDPEDAQRVLQAALDKVGVMIVLKGEG